MTDFIMFEGTIEASSGKAVLFQADFWETAAWIPRSQAVIREVPGTEGRWTVEVAEWLVKKNRWDY